MEITQPILERYQSWLYYHRTTRGRPLGVSTQKQILISVREYFRWLTRTRRTLFNPAAELDLPKTGKRLPRDVMTAEEVECVLNQPNVKDPIGLRDRAILEVLYSTGMRRTELAQLKIYDIDVARGTVQIQQGKGGKDRVTPIGERALAWVDRYLTEARPLLAVEPDEGYLFLTCEGRAFLPPIGLGQLVRRHIINANIGKTGGPHLFRHAVATQMLENGVDIRFIQELLGHSKIETTQVYTQVSIQKLKEVHRQSHPAERSWRNPATPRPPSEPEQSEQAQEFVDAQVDVEEGDEPEHP
jgi:integrase/recombinase XerD